MAIGQTCMVVIRYGDKTLKAKQDCEEGRTSEPASYGSFVLGCLMLMLVCVTRLIPALFRLACQGKTLLLKLFGSLGTLCGPGMAIEVADSTQGFQGQEDKEKLK